VPDALSILAAATQAAPTTPQWAPSLIAAEAVYVLCMLTCLVCAVLLGLGYRRSRAPLLLWSSLCFVFLTLNNLLLFLDLIVFPQIDLGPLRDWSALLGMVVLVFGLIWNSD
jgi:hypothetical protein